MQGCQAEIASHTCVVWDNRMYNLLPSRPELSAGHRSLWDTKDLKSFQGSCKVGFKCNHTSPGQSRRSVEQKGKKLAAPQARRKCREKAFIWRRPCSHCRGENTLQCQGKCYVSDVLQCFLPNIGLQRIERLVDLKGNMNSLFMFLSLKGLQPRSPLRCTV